MAEFVVNIVHIGLGISLGIADMQDIKRLVGAGDDNAARNLDVVRRRARIVGVNRVRIHKLAACGIGTFKFSESVAAQGVQCALDFLDQLVLVVILVYRHQADGQLRRVIHGRIRIGQRIGIRLAVVRKPSRGCFKGQAQRLRLVLVIGEGQRRQRRGGGLVDRIDQHRRRAGVLALHGRCSRRFLGIGSCDDFFLVSALFLGRIIASVIKINFLGHQRLAKNVLFALRLGSFRLLRRRRECLLLLARCHHHRGAQDQHQAKDPLLPHTSIPPSFII